MNLRLRNAFAVPTVVLWTVVVASSAKAVILTDSWISDYLAETVYELTGRQLTIAGEFDIDWGIKPSVRITQVRFDNSAWASQPHMAKIDELVLQIDLRSLVGGEFRFPQLKLTGPEFWLEVDSSGEKTNWTFEGSPDVTLATEAEQALQALEQPTTSEAIAERVQELEPSEVEQAVATLRPDDAESTDDELVLPSFDQLLFENAVVHYNNRNTNAEFNARIDRASGSVSDEQITLSAEGALAEQPLRLALNGGSLEALREAGTSYPVEAKLQVGNSTLSVAGQTDGLLQLSQLAMDINARLEQPLPLVRTFGYDAPLPSPFNLNAQLSYSGPQWQLRDLNISYDDSQLAGMVTVDLDGERPQINGQIDAATLDLRPFVPATTTDDSDSEITDSEQLLAPLQTFGADLQLQVDKLLGPNQLNLNKLAVELQVEDGQLRVAPLKLALGGGEAQAALQLDSNAINADSKPVAELAVNLNQINLGQASKQLGVAVEVPGTVNGELKLNLPELPASLVLEDVLPALRIDQARLSYLAPSIDADFDLRLSQQNDKLSIAGQGSYQQKPLKLNLQGDSLAALAGSESYALAGTAIVNNSKIVLDGNLGLAAEPINANFNIRSRRFKLAEDQILQDVNMQVRYTDGEFFLAPSTLSYTNTALNLQADANLKIRNNKLRVEADGQYKEEPFNMRLTGEPPLTLFDDDPYALNAQLKIARTELEVDGSIDQPLEFEGLNINFALAGPNPALLSDVTGYPLPDLPPYTVEGKLARQGQKLRFQTLDGRVGDSDLGGSLALDLGATPLAINADLSSNKLDFDDLGGLVGTAPDTGSGETASSGQKREARQEAKSPFILPREPLGLSAATNQFNGVIDYRGKQVVAQSLPLDDLSFELKLNGQLVQLIPLEFGIGNGRVSSRIELDTSGEQPKGKIKGEVLQVNLRKVLAPFDISDDSLGVFGGRFKFWVSGDSMADLFASADGGLFLLMTGGRLDQLLVEIAGLDPGEVALSLSGDDDGTIPIDCAYLDVYTRNGIATITNALVDTRDTLFLADGFVDFNQELIDLVVDPKPKDFSLLSAQAPLHLEGRLSSPKAYPGPSALVKLGTAAVLGVGLTPLAAVLPLIETGDGEESVYCNGLVTNLDQAR